jgi:type 1 glutamine amidotransferase
MRTLALLEDEWHFADVPQAGLQRLEQFGFEFRWLENTDDLSAQQLAQYPIVILAKANHFSSTDKASGMPIHAQQIIADHVQSGGGLLVLHAGAAASKDAVHLRRLMGGAFCEHPAQCLVKAEPQASHRLATECDSFEVLDEQYVMDLDDEHADIFLRTTSKHGIQAAGWIRSEGEGRVCVLTPGHNLHVWLHPVYQQILLNALCWCGKKI